MAGTTGLEPATSAVTGQRSNQLSYVPRLFFNNFVLCHIESSISQLSPFSLSSTQSRLWTHFQSPGGHRGVHPNRHRNDKNECTRRDRDLCPRSCSLTQKIRMAFSLSMRQRLAYGNSLAKWFEVATS